MPAPSPSISAAPRVGRFAPSPTGPLHFRSLVAAVGSYIAARHAGGSWILRIEDLDRQRVVQGMADDILRTLEALGFRWDGEIVYQSRRTQAYEAAFRALAEMGAVYACGCSRSEIAASVSAPHGTGGEVPYPGTCRDGLAPGKSPRAWRVRVPEEEIAFTDAVFGRCSEDLRRSCGDFVVRRADGLFAYQLAVVVDDAAAGVTDVVRGADLLSSTPRQILLQRLLGYPQPRYLHLPLVTGPGGEKLSKRDNAVSVGAAADLQRDGGALITACLRFLGHHPPAGLSATEALAWGSDHFDAASVPREGGALFLPAAGKKR